MVSVGRHPNIELLSYSEVENVSGYVGNFTVQVRRKRRYVDETLCTGCGTCVEKCPWKKIPSSSTWGWAPARRSISPSHRQCRACRVIDAENCAYLQKGKCRACEKFCQTGAINFNQPETIRELEVGTIILATGFHDFDPSRGRRVWLRQVGQCADQHAV